MKLTNMILPMILLVVSLTACEKVLFGWIKGKGSDVTETRPLINFNKIKLGMDAEVTYVQDSVYYVELTAQANVLEVLTTNVVASELRIDTRKWVRKHNPIIVIVHSPDIKSLNISGSGNINAPGVIATNDLSLHISGSGNISLYELQSAELNASISGSGNISIGNGVVSNEKATISGSGDIDALGLAANSVAAKISGSGNISVYAVQQLDATISGSGDIHYTGQPSVNTHISGSGSVVHL